MKVMLFSISFWVFYNFFIVSNRNYSQSIDKNLNNDSNLILLWVKNDSLLKYYNSMEHPEIVTSISIDAYDDSIFLNPLCNFNSLKFIELKNIKNKQLPSCLKELTLYSIDLYLGCFNKIDSSSLNWSNLKAIRVYGSDLKMMNMGIDNKLETLAINSNKLKEFTFIKTLKYIRVLDLTSMKLKNIPNEIYGLKNLHELYLGHNFFKKFNFNNLPAFKSPQIRVINLDHCNIRNINPSVFDQYAMLEEISLIGNPLSTSSLKLIKEYNGKINFVIKSETKLRVIN